MNMPEYEEEIWEKVKELDMTAQEMQEVGLQRYEVFTYEDKLDTAGNKIVIWDNLEGDQINGPGFKSEEKAMEEIKRIMERELSL